MENLKEKTQQAIAESTAMLIEKLSSGNSAALTEYLDAMARFHNYSFGNVMLIARQAPHATRVAGFQAWKEFGRFVKKGEKGILIMAPIVVTKDRDGEKLEHGHMVGCRGVYVFDVSQTDGQELPEVSMDVAGDPGKAMENLLAFCASRGITVEMVDGMQAFGVSHKGKIELRSGQPAAHMFATLVHETAHELMHDKERRQETSKTIRETEAEAVAYIVCTSLGMDCGNSSADYIRLYNGDSKTLAESLSLIQAIAKQICAAVTEDAA